MIRTYLLVGAGAVILAFGVYHVRVVNQRDALELRLRDARIELASKDETLRQMEDAARVHRVYLDRFEAEQARWAEIERELKSMEGRDAPLSPLLQSTAERLYGR